MLSIIRHARTRRRLVCLPLSLLATTLFSTLNLFAADANLRGTVTDPLGAAVAGAKLELIPERPNARPNAAASAKFETATSGPDGAYSFTIATPGRYRVCAVAATFEPTNSASFFVGASGTVEADITLATATQTQQITVTATGTPTPEAQTAAPVTVLSAAEYRDEPRVQDALRIAPGVQITQSGQTGGKTDLFVRGGNDNATKVLVDGVPVNDIGGAVEFANYATVGIAKMELLREPNSALYGSDALAGVLNLTTARGHSPLPLFTYDGGAGNFGTYRNEVTAGGVYRRFDLYSAFARMDTRNNLPRDQFHNGTYVGNFGWQPNAANDLRFTVRHLAENGGQPGSVLLYGIADDAARKEQDTQYSAAWNNQATDRWHNQLRYGGLRLRSQIYEYGVAEPDAGEFVTITGANGYTAFGPVLLSTYPGETDLATDRDFVYAQTDFRFNPHIVALGAFKYEAERGTDLYVAYPPAGTVSQGNYSYTTQLSGDIKNRLYYILGSGLEKNGLYGFAATPRASLAYYAVRPSSSELFSGTKLHASFGKGIKETSILNQESSLYSVLAGEPNGAALIAQYGVKPIGAEYARSFDAGVEQELAHGRARVGITYFHNQFTNGVEYVPQSGLVTLGVPAAQLAEFEYGATVNSLAFRAQGIEFTSEYRLASHLFARGGYTYLDAVVQRSFSSDALCNPCAQNPDIPGVNIGGYSPLVGARPFRRAPHTGYFGLDYNRSKFYGSVTGSLVGKRDDSDFLLDADANYGNSLLLPNRNLDGSYERLDLSAGYQWRPNLTTYINAQNLLSEHYVEAFGYPALPLTFRAGLKLSFGGEGWSLK
jgi:iron complex outermembrane receptor protein/vitamin B12 transporter